MRTRRLRVRARALAPVAVVTAALLLSACAAGQDAQTADELPTLDGTSANIGDLQLRGMTVDAPKGNYYPKGTDATMRLVISNTGTRADTLTGISGSVIKNWHSYRGASTASHVAVVEPSAASSSSSSSAGSTSTQTGQTTVGAGLRLSFGTPDATNSLLLMSFSRPVYPGTVISLTFTFDREGSKTVEVPVAITDTPNDSVIPSAPASGQSG